MADNKAQSAESKPRIRFSIRFKFSLSIITLLIVIISTITVYIVLRERELLKTQIYQLIKRELIHLANTTQRNLGVDDLPVSSAISDIKKIDYAKYSYVLNNDMKIVYFFDDIRKSAIGEQIKDGIDRDKGVKGDNAISVIIYEDPADANGEIHDFSKDLTRIDGTVFAKVVIGISDKIIRDETSNLLWAIIPIFLGFLIISVLGSVILAGIIIKPIKKLSLGAEIIGKGNFDHRIEIASSDELGQLAREFNQMTSMIREAKDQEIESRLMSEQMEMAKEIQEGLNPMGFYEKDGIEIKGFTRAAKGVGGDYFDYIDIDQYRVGALISDVSGKGVPASLVMVMIRTVFTSYVTREDIDCAAVVTAINDALSADFAIDKFATLFFVIYNRKTEELAFSNAGHAPLFLYRAETNSCTFAKLDGVPIGIMEDVDYNQARVQLNKGDIVLMFSDGVTEMRNADRNEYGLNRVIDLLIANNKISAKDIVDMLVQDVDSFRGDVPPHDDMTMLVMKRSE